MKQNHERTTILAHLNGKKLEDNMKSPLGRKDPGHKITFKCKEEKR